MTCTRFVSFMAMFFLLLVLVLVITSTSAQTPIYMYNFCNSTEKSISTSYQSNINKLLLWSNSDSATGTESNHTTLGNNNSGYDDVVYGSYNCRGDIADHFCQFCINSATKEIAQRCSNSVSAIIWYDLCIIRYSNENYFGKVIVTPSWNVTATKSIKDSTELGKAEDFMRSLIRKMIEANRLWATSEFNWSDTEKRYGLVQCSGDLNNDGCRQCLETLLDKIRLCCGTKVTWAFIAPSCGIKFDDQMFYQLTEKTGSSSPMPNSAKHGGASNIKTLIITLSSVLVAVAFVCCCVHRRLSKGKLLFSINSKADHDHVQSDDSLNGDLPTIPLTVIQQSTKYFSASSKLGEGGFGPVYKGTLPDGTEIAVKRLADTSNQGLEEFKNEVIFIAKLQHRNLVKLLGCCIEENEKILVYEYMPNSSLDFHLFNEEKHKQLDWNLQLSIVNGIARGLQYLHEDSRLRVIHRDLKASNVLLDSEMIPKISDFGLARKFESGRIQTKTKRVVGTYGYMAPEYAMVGLFSVKSDVYSFGVLILEIIYGKRNGEFFLSEHRQSLLLYTWRLWCEGNCLKIINPNHKESYIASEVLKCIHIGLLCVQEDAADRPTMSTVVVMLGSDTMTLPKPKQPGFSVRRMSDEEVITTSKSSKDNFVDEVPITIVAPR